MKKTLFLPALFASIAAFSQIGINTSSPAATLDITAKNATGTSANVDGLLVPRVDRQRAQSMVNVTNSTLIYVNDVTTGTQTGTATNIDAVGYYYFDETNVWTKLKETGVSATGINIYNNDGTLISNRTVNMDGRTLNFVGNTIDSRIGIDGLDSRAKLNVNGYIQFSQDSDWGVGKAFVVAGQKYGLTQVGSPQVGTGNSPGTRIYTSGANTQGHISFGKYISDTAFTEWARFAHNTGNFGINTSVPTERLHNNGNVRLQGLPLNGAINAINTTSVGGVSSSQNQTFTATRTLVSDTNGVLGYISGVPTITEPGSQTLNYARSVTSPINSSTPANSEVTIGNISIRFNGTSSSAANIEYKVSQSNHVTILYHKGGNGGTNLEEWGRQASVAGTWYSFTGEIGNATRDINPSNRDIAYAIITLHNSKDVYRVTANVNGDIAASGSVPSVASSVTLFVEKFSL
ncbi:hypothetical protein [Chryseobacterium shigense]|uniref:Uncharacterized protein n=1 Tax=Chryseobacterium shigense TaxID=297244 RepID=A0A841NCU2_9FLAO|nr:hypothetical protein [Chryseobacterium shigense]MBB6371150.1 hypothetical protein [Chryseobacterium shigense]